MTLTLSKKENNKENVKILIGDSQIFSKEEINDAVNVVLENFNFPASLNEILYDEERSLSDIKWYVDNYNTDEIIVLFSNFTTYSSTDTVFFMSGLLMQNDKYTDYSWILVCSNDESWKLITQEY